MKIFLQEKNNVKVQDGKEAEDSQIRWSGKMLLRQFHLGWAQR